MFRFFVVLFCCCCPQQRLIRLQDALQFFGYVCSCICGFFYLFLFFFFFFFLFYLFIYLFFVVVDRLRGALQFFVYVYGCICGGFIYLFIFCVFCFVLFFFVVAVVDNKNWSDWGALQFFFVFSLWSLLFVHYVFLISHSWCLGKVVLRPSLWHFLGIFIYLVFRWVDVRRYVFDRHDAQYSLV